MGKIHKPNDMTDVTVEDINEALSKVIGVLNGSVDTSNISTKNSVPLGIQAEKIVDYPTSRRPIYGDKFIVKKGSESFDYMIPQLLEAMDANRDYTLLEAETKLSYLGGEHPQGITVNSKYDKIGITDGTTLKKSKVTVPYPSEKLLIIPKTSDIKMVRLSGLPPLFTYYVNASLNLKSTWRVTLGIPTETADEIVFPVVINSYVQEDETWDSDSHVDLFIKVEVLCEVLP